MGIKTKTSFSKENQPKNKGRKKGVKVGYIYISNRLEAVTGEQLTDFTPLTTAQILNISNFLLMQDASVLNGICQSEDMPMIIRMIAEEFTTTKQPLDTIYKMSDRIAKTQDTKPKQLQLGFNDIDYENKLTQEGQDAQS
jgi:hypothetical protein